MHCGVMVTGYNQGDWERLLRGDYDRPPTVSDAANMDETLALGELVEPLGFDSIWATEHYGSAYSMVPLQITHPRKSAGEYRVVIVSGMLGQATPPTLDGDSDSIGQASAARPCLAASRHRHGLIWLRLGQATRRSRH